MPPRDLDCTAKEPDGGAGLRATNNWAGLGLERAVCRTQSGGREAAGRPLAALGCSSGLVGLLHPLLLFSSRSPTPPPLPLAPSFSSYSSSSLPALASPRLRAGSERVGSAGGCCSSPAPRSPDRVGRRGSSGCGRNRSSTGAGPGLGSAPDRLVGGPQGPAHSQTGRLHLGFCSVQPRSRESAWGTRHLRPSAARR